jgi:hypothetical protein
MMVMDDWWNIMRKNCRPTNELKSHREKKTKDDAANVE